MRKLTTLALAAIFAAGLLPMAFAVEVSDFNDVAGHWGEEHLIKMIEAGIIAGDGSGNALPDKTIERWEAAVMLAKLFGLESLGLGDAVTGHYTDITTESPYVEEYINDIIAAGFMVGSDGRFEPGRVMSREEAFTAIRNAFKLPDADGGFTSAFPDADTVSDWAEGHVLAIEAAGLIAGKNGGIAPGNAVTRAEFITLLSKLSEDKDSGTGADILVHAVHSSVTIDITDDENGVTLTLTGELDYEDNIFLTRSASDFACVVGGDGRPLASIKNGAYTAVEINVKEIMAHIGFGTVDILQTNLALSVYDAGGNIAENGGVWTKETSDRVPAEFDDEFCVLVFGGETATLLFTAQDGELLITVDATGLVVNGAV
jgi:hypothetical protein